MEIQKMPLDTLISPVYNPRDITATDLRKLKKSIKTFGFNDPLIVNKRNNHIIAGSQRFKVLRELNEEDEELFSEVDCVLVDLDENNEKAFNIAHNKIGGEFNEEKLNEILIELDMEDFDISVTGFDLNFEIKEISEEGGIRTDIDKMEMLHKTIQVIVDCYDEEEQKELYSKLTEAGYECQTLTL